MWLCSRTIGAEVMVRFIFCLLVFVPLELLAVSPVCQQWFSASKIEPHSRSCFQQCFTSVTSPAETGCSDECEQSPVRAVNSLEGGSISGLATLARRFDHKPPKKQKAPLGAFYFFGGGGNRHSAGPWGRLRAGEVPLPESVAQTILRAKLPVRFPLRVGDARASLRITNLQKNKKPLLGLFISLEVGGIATPPALGAGSGPGKFRFPNLLPKRYCARNFPFDSPLGLATLARRFDHKPPKKQKAPLGAFYFFGGGGNRTPVRK